MSLWFVLALQFFVWEDT
ncbi:hypothetical protein Gotur_028074 [Gossypium turneri]